LNLASVSSHKAVNGDDSIRDYGRRKKRVETREREIHSPFLRFYILYSCPYRPPTSPNVTLYLLSLSLPPLSLSLSSLSREFNQGGCNIK